MGERETSRRRSSSDRRSHKRPRGILLALAAAVAIAGPWQTSHQLQLCQTAPSVGNYLLILESSGKIKKVQQALGSHFRVVACGGHVTEIVTGQKAQAYGKDCSFLSRRFGIDIDKGFAPFYACTKAEKIRMLKSLSTQVDAVYLATDPDREGEAIAWHLVRELRLPKRLPVHRVSFSEITPAAIQKALKQPTAINEALVRAQEARAVVDRLAGFTLSAMVSKEVPRNSSGWISAGRVQSPALRLVVSREREIQNFNSTEYYKLAADFKVEGTESTIKTFFVPETRAGKGSKLALPSDQADALLKVINSGEAMDAKVKLYRKGERKAFPKPAFNKVSLTSEAERALGMTPESMAAVAQKLYEKGLITYVRTDSTELSEDGVQVARASAAGAFSEVPLPPKGASRKPAPKRKHTQEAHEAIRPSISASGQFPHPDSLSKQLASQEAKLYTLIWKRTLSSVMAPAKYNTTRIVFEVQFLGKSAKSLPLALRNVTFEHSSEVLADPGYLTAHGRVAGKSGAPRLQQGDKAQLSAASKKSQKTSPPSRFSEGGLVEELEALGIGRPSTYESVLRTLKNRGYVDLIGGKLHPKELAFPVLDVLSETYEEIIQYNYTATLEAKLDAIAKGGETREQVLKDFYYGQENSTGLETHVVTYMR